jgi:hypothetical protein
VSLSNISLLLDLYVFTRLVLYIIVLNTSYRNQSLQIHS